MKYEDALAVYLYLRHQPPGTRDEGLFSAAWGAICQHAEETIKNINSTRTNHVVHQIKRS